MIPLIVFYIHIIAVVYFFTREYQKEGTGAGVLTVAFMALIFSVGWSICTFALKYIMEPEGFGRWLDRDALSLMILTIGETIFYYYYFRESKKA
ncbi:MAG: hypothetical protein ACYC09_09295 [Bacteroidota bacterium]